MVKHHLRLGVDGLFLAGTCGKGPSMPNGAKQELINEVRAHAGGRLGLAVQVTDNSAARVLEQIAALEGVDYVVVAQPYLAMNATPATLGRFYQDILDLSPIPVCYYERGRASVVSVPDDVLTAVLLHKNLKMVKDSSGDPVRRELLLKAKGLRPDISLLIGDEFRCVDYLTAGYDGVMFGEAVLNARYVMEMMAHLSRNDLTSAKAIERRMTDMLYAIYGGPSISCWMHGLKTMLVRMGIFKTTSSYLDYPLTDECSSAIDLVLATDREFLLPA